MKLSPTIAFHFDGRCEQAFKFYEQCLDARIAFMLKWGDSPMGGQTPKEWASKILHGRISIGNTEIVGGDVLPEHYQRPQGCGLILNTADPAYAERIFNCLAQNGTILAPLQKTFWALRYGIVTDQFGLRWEINCEESQ
jgi:PhnB protein